MRTRGWRFASATHPPRHVVSGERVTPTICWAALAVINRAQVEESIGYDVFTKIYC